MSGVARFLALAAMAGALAGCVTDGMIGAEVETQAKPRVVDTAKTKSAAKKDSAKKNATKPAQTAQGDTTTRIAAVRAEPDTKTVETTPFAPRTQDEGARIPAHTLFGNWTLNHEGAAPCKVILGGVPIGSGYAARGESDCPKAFTAVQTWEIQGDEIVLRNQARGVVGRLQPTGPFRFDGQGEGGTAVHLVR